ncbi:MAG: response regulator transcription factor [Oscillospiraceae bacterium]|jgi:DNA-binding response OmpR family regulator|nr:response regulator transcription factor [Oscillospiraceae bacterium]
MGEQSVILLVEDNVNILHSNRRILERCGLTALTAETLREARGHLKIAAPDVVVLDIMLPDGNGLEFLPELRESCVAPVLFLTAKDSPDEKLTGLCAGGNDYITKPYDINEFRQRVLNFLALLRMNREPGANLSLGSIKLDAVTQRGFLNDRDMVLSPKEFALLHLFAAREDEALSAETLYEKVWQAPMNNDDRAVRFQISQLRAKLDGSGYTIGNKRGEGYCLEKEKC